MCIRDSEYTEVGIAFEAPEVRVARMAESAEILRRLWTGEEVSFTGRHYRIETHRCFPPPVQVEWVRSTAGDRFAQLELSTLVQGVTLTPKRSAVASEIQPLLPSLAVDDVLSSPYVLIGAEPQIAEQLRVQREHLGISYITVFEKDLEPMAKVIELLR